VWGKVVSRTEIRREKVFDEEFQECLGKKNI
jgi:hypothetical protein